MFPPRSGARRFKTLLTHGKGCGSAAVAGNGAGSGKATSVSIFCLSSRKMLRTLWMFRVLQRFATSLQNDLSPKTIINVLETIFAVLRYAKKSGMRTEYGLFLRFDRQSSPRLQSVRTSRVQQVGQIVGAAKEPYKTMFALASVMGARAGELMALTVPDLDFRAKDDSCEQIRGRSEPGIVRQPKTKKSVALLPMPSDLEAMLRNYLKNHWKENPKQLALPCSTQRRILQVKKQRGAVRTKANPPQARHPC